MMSSLLKLGCILFALTLLQEAVAQFRTNFWLTGLYPCNKTSPTVFHANFKNENGNQYLNFNITMPLSLDEHIGSIIKIDSKVDGNNYITLFTIREKYLCRTANTYLGEFWYDIERAAQIPPRICPIRAGRYNIHHLRLNFKKVALQTFPFGKIKFTTEAIDNRSSKCLFCIIAEVDNRPN